MSASRLQIVNQETSRLSIELNALYEIKVGMQDALMSEDWTQLKCLDRVCGRIINQLCMTDRVYMKKVMDQLNEIKHIYKLALEFMNASQSKSPLKAL